MLEASMTSRSPLLASTLLAGLTLAPLTARAADTYEVQAPPAKATVGAKAKASVTITGKNGWHVNEDAPVSVKVSPPAGVSVDKPKLTRADLAERTKDRARFDVAFTAAEPGTKTIEAEARFVMCQEQACKPVTEKISLAVEVAPAKK
jgi:hypothetical protein